MPRRLLGIRKVCELLDCSDDTVRRLVKRGDLAPPRQYRGLGLRWEEGDIEDYIARERLRQQGVPVDEPTPPPPPKPKKGEKPPPGEPPVKT